MMVMPYKEILSSLAILLTFAAFYLYIRPVMKGKTRPHVFSWIIWGSTTFVIFLAQLADKGGAGAWPIGVSGIISIYIAILAFYKKADNSITSLDWIFLITAVLGMLLWYFTSDPLWTVLILTSIDVIGFGPTMRKAYHHPHEEHLTFFILMAIRNLTALLALEHYSLTTMSFPAATGLACLVFIIMVVYRRKIILA